MNVLFLIGNNIILLVVNNNFRDKNDVTRLTV